VIKIPGSQQIPGAQQNEHPELDDDTRPHGRRGLGLQSGIPSTRTSVSWTAVAVAIIALVVVVVFILENLHATDATFFGAHWRIPLGLDLLLAALLGAAAVFVVGAARTLQLRLLARRTMRARDAVTPSLTDEPKQEAGAESSTGEMS
jgi:uncharacterized integral membrane protein